MALTASVELRNGRVLLPEGRAQPVSVSIQGDRIVGFGAQEEHVVDVDGCWVLPGIVDLHGDAFERTILPRPSSRVPYTVGFAEACNQIVNNGITTAFLAMTLSWEWFRPLRNQSSFCGLVALAESARAISPIELKINMRFEIAHRDGVSLATDMIRSRRVDLVSLADHSGQVLSRLERNATDTRVSLLCNNYINTRRLVSLYGDAASDTQAKKETLEQIVHCAIDTGITTVSHDDPDPSTRLRMHNLGCDISEFPRETEVAATAFAHGGSVLMGAPNLLMGGSTGGGPSASELIQDGLCHALVSDYYYPALLQSVFAYCRRGSMPIERVWPLVSGVPARLAGLDDRGSIEKGLRADIIVVRESPANTPVVEMVMVGGRVVLSRGRIVR